MDSLLPFAIWKAIMVWVLPIAWGVWQLRQLKKLDEADAAQARDNASDLLAEDALDKAA